MRRAAELKSYKTLNTKSAQPMSILLGIDTGGTYTDAVLFDEEHGVMDSAKSLTTKHDLSIGVGKAIEAVLPTDSSLIRLVSISTT